MAREACYSRDERSGCGLRADARAPGNRRTIESYEQCAAEYARATSPRPGSDDRYALERFIEALPTSARVLEIGSGPGWDADWLESHGAVVRRTDATEAFVAMQRNRGASADLLDVVTDELGGPYAGAIALYVFQHIDRPQLAGVLAKISRAISDRGVLMFSLRDGKGETVERGTSGSTYYIAEWEKPEVDLILRDLGFRERWSKSSEDAEGRWLTILTIKEGR